MESGFDFELYGDTFTNCFIHISRYVSGNLQISLFGVDPNTSEIAHFVDITLDQNAKKLNGNEIVVDCLYKPTLIPQLKELGILKEQIGICIVNSDIYPIYTVNFNNTSKCEYKINELAVA